MASSFINFKHYRYLKQAIILSIVTVFLYMWHDPSFPPNGGTWLGYTLGILAFLLMLWLTYFGVRKRRYRRGRSMLKGWLSAHVYLGLVLVVFASFHTGFQFGINLHTLAYVLVILEVITGLYGVYVYLYYPSRITDNIGEQTFPVLLDQIDKLEQDALNLAVEIGKEAYKSVTTLIKDTRVGGSVHQQLSTKIYKQKMSKEFDKLLETIQGNDSQYQMEDMMKTMQFSEADFAEPDKDNISLVHNLLDLLARKKQLVDKANRHIRYKAHLDIWLYFHVPLAFAALAAVIAHIVSVFIYW